MLFGHTNVWTDKCLKSYVCGLLLSLYVGKWVIEHVVGKKEGGQWLPFSTTAFWKNSICPTKWLIYVPEKMFCYMVYWWVHIDRYCSNYLSFTQVEANVINTDIVTCHTFFPVAASSQTIRLGCIWAAYRKLTTAFYFHHSIFEKSQLVAKNVCI